MSELLSLPKRVLLLGWDAADWKVIHPLIEEGSMPNLARLIQRGVHGNIATIHPPLSPTLWTSISTGKRPPKHGVLGFSEPTPDGRGVRPVSILSRKTKALWNILAQNGKRSLVVGWWPSHPAEPIPGVMVSDFFRMVPSDPEVVPPPPARGTIHPPELAAELADLRVQPHEIPGEVLRMFVPKFDEVDQTRDKSLHDLAKIIAETMSVHAVATELLEREEWDLAAIYFDAIDHFSHRFMRYHPPRQPHVPEEEFAFYSEIVANAYRYHDAMLGRYLELIGPGTHVIVMSDHGFHSDALRPGWIPVEPAGPAVEHRQHGMIVMAGPEFANGERIFGSSILDITPTLLTLFGLPVGEDMDGNVLRQAWTSPPEIRRIPSWDDVPGEAGCHPPEAAQDPRESAAALEQLVALGYIAPLPDDAAEAVRETVRELDYNLARSLIDAGKPHEAIPVLEKLWKEWPGENRFGSCLLDALNRCGRIGERRAALNRLHEKSQKLALEAREELQKLEPLPEVDAIEARSPELRREHYRRRKLQELSQGLAMWLQQAEMIQLQLEGKAGQAAAQADDLLSAENLPLPTLLFAADIYARSPREGDAARAIALLDAVDQVLPENAHSSALRAEIAWRQQDWQSTLEAAAESLGLLYFNPRLHTLLGLALLKLGRKEEAKNELLVAVKQNPAQLAALEQLEDLFRDQPEQAFVFRSMREAHTAALEERKRQRKLPPARAALPTYEFKELCSLAPDTTPPQDGECVIVSGLPRSGTSMLMRVLAAGGMPLLVDEERPADENNRLGYFEFAPVKNSPRNVRWLEQAGGKAVKVVAPLLRYLPAAKPLRIVVMHRPLEQVLDSQQAMIQRLGATASEDQAAAGQFARLMQQLPSMLEKKSGWSVLHVSYEAMLANPREQCARLALFLGPNWDPVRAVAAVDPSQKRFGRAKTAG